MQLTSLEGLERGTSAGAPSYSRPFPGSVNNCMLACCTQVGSADATTAAAGAEQLVAACHQARQFTDIANFTLRCGVCQIGLKGEKEAAEHAKATGHQNFSEY